MATTTQPNIYYSEDNSPEMSPDKWWTTSSGQGIVQFTGVSKNWDDVVEGDTFKRGDIVYYNGDYYVCKVQGYSGIFTVDKDLWNNNHPESSAGEWAWYKLSS